MQINFDMDGTLVDFYGVEDWLEYLEEEDTLPYEIAKPLLKLSTLARKLNQLIKKGYEIGIISWTSKNGSDEFNKQVTEAKLEWLTKHLPSVKFSHIEIVPYGTPKWFFGSDILFDDEQGNRNEWIGQAYDETQIMEILKSL